VDENSDEGDGPMSAETISFEIQVECARRRDGGVGAEGSGQERAGGRDAWTSTQAKGDGAKEHPSTLTSIYIGLIK